MIRNRTRDLFSRSLVVVAAAASKPQTISYRGNEARTLPTASPLHGLPSMTSQTLSAQFEHWDWPGRYQTAFYHSSRGTIYERRLIKIRLRKTREKSKHPSTRVTRGVVKTMQHVRILFFFFNKGCGTRHYRRVFIRMYMLLRSCPQRHIVRH